VDFGRLYQNQRVTPRVIRIRKVADFQKLTVRCSSHQFRVDAIPPEREVLDWCVSVQPVATEVLGRKSARIQIEFLSDQPVSIGIECRFEIVPAIQILEGIGQLGTFLQGIASPSSFHLHSLSGESFTIDSLNLDGGCSVSTDSRADAGLHQVFVALDVKGVGVHSRTLTCAIRHSDGSRKEYQLPVHYSVIPETDRRK
jgi:hypothetical protein